jgi:hypothetical protein
MLDGAAYTPGGREVFCQMFRLEVEVVLRRYDAVLHLESLATADPTWYSQANNEARFENLAEAQRLEQATRAAWAGHPYHRVIAGRQRFDGKLAEVLSLIRALLAEHEG